jgi:hypothetical protein
MITLVVTLLLLLGVFYCWTFILKFWVVKGLQYAHFSSSEEVVMANETSLLNNTSPANHTVLFNHTELAKTVADRLSSAFSRMLGNKSSMAVSAVSESQ